MKLYRILTIFFLLCCPSFLDSAIAQFIVTQIDLQSEFVIVENSVDYWITDFNHHSYYDDTSAAEIIFRADSSSLILNSVLDFHYLHPDGFNWVPPTDSVSLVVKFDQKLTQILSLVYFRITGDESAPNSTVYQEGISLKNIPITISKGQDTLSAFLLGSQLRILPFAIKKNSVGRTSRSQTTSITDSIVSIPNTSFLSIKLIGKFSNAGVLEYQKGELTNSIIITNPKLLKIPSQTSNQDQPLLCYDLLGRKHNLEFLGADNTSATYSVRSLRPGVYFVNDGRETVKFIIGE